VDTDGLSIKTDAVINDTDGLSIDTDAIITDTEAIISDPDGLSVETDANTGVQRLLAWLFLLFSLMSEIYTVLNQLTISGEVVSYCVKTGKF
jgi:hypothetical protein